MKTRNRAALCRDVRGLLECHHGALYLQEPDHGASPISVFSRFTLSFLNLPVRTPWRSMHQPKPSVEASASRAAPGFGRRSRPAPRCGPYRAMAVLGAFAFLVGFSPGGLSTSIGIV